MVRHIETLYRDVCPRFDRITEISVKYVEIPILGKMSPGYKKTSFYCADVNDCPKLDEYGRCPLVIKAPDSPSTR